MLAGTLVSPNVMLLPNASERRTKQSGAADADRGGEGGRRRLRPPLVSAGGVGRSRTEGYGEGADHSAAGALAPPA